MSSDLIGRSTQVSNAQVYNVIIVIGRSAGTADAWNYVLNAKVFRQLAFLKAGFGD